MKELVEHCRVCGHKVDVHGAREKTEKLRKAVYASCTNKECSEKGKEVSYQEVESSEIRCEVCRTEVTVLGSRKRNGCRGARYGACSTDGCRKKGRVICYLGSPVALVKPSYTERRRREKEYMNAPRIGI